jgi:hypothetical protein
MEENEGVSGGSRVKMIMRNDVNCRSTDLMEFYSDVRSLEGVKSLRKSVAKRGLCGRRELSALGAGICEQIYTGCLYTFTHGGNVKNAI